MTKTKSKTISNEIKLATDPNSAICYLTEELTCGFENCEQELIVPKNMVKWLRHRGQIIPNSDLRISRIC